MDNTTLKDESIICDRCGSNFIFTVGEQQFYSSKGFNPPKRCKPCRDLVKAEKAAKMAQVQPAATAAPTQDYPDDNRGNRRGYNDNAYSAPRNGRGRYRDDY